MVRNSTQRQENKVTDTLKGCMSYSTQLLRIVADRALNITISRCTKNVNKKTHTHIKTHTTRYTTNHN